MTFAHDKMNPAITSRQVIINKIIYRFLNGYTDLQTTDGISFDKDKDKTLPQENSLLIQQNAGEIGKENYMEYDDDDLAAYDITQTNVIIDGAWHELDLDTYKTVPSNAIGFLGNIYIEGTAINQLIIFRDTSQNNEYQASNLRTKNDNIGRGILPISLDSNHKFDYRCNANLIGIGITVVWWIQHINNKRR